MTGHGQPEDTGEQFDRRLPFGVLQAEFPMPEWLWEARMAVLYVWALELNELDPDVRDAVLEVQADMGWPF